MNRRRLALNEWRTGWRYVLCNDVGQMSFLVKTYATGVMIKPLSDAFGWSRAEVSGNMAAYAVVTFFWASLAGRLVDRFGARRMALIGAPLSGLIVAAGCLAGPSIWSWYAVWAAFALVSPFISTVLWPTVICRHFDVSRGLALSVGASGNGLGALVWPPLAILLIERFNWRIAFLGMGLIIGLGLTTICYFLLKGPAAEASSSRPMGSGDRSLVPEGATLGQALRSSVFWCIAISLTIMGASVGALLVHLPALLTDKGMSGIEAATVMTALAPSVVAGRVIGGILLDKLHGRYVTFVILIAAAAACATLISYNGSYSRAIIAAILIGITSGVEGDLISFLIARYFGIRNLAAILGAAIAIFTVGYGVAPTLVGAIFDAQGSYDGGMISLVVALLACAPFVLMLPIYPYHAD